MTVKQIGKPEYEHTCDGPECSARKFTQNAECPKEWTGLELYFALYHHTGRYYKGNEEKTALADIPEGGQDFSKLEFCSVKCARAYAIGCIESATRPLLTT